MDKQLSTRAEALIAERVASGKFASADAFVDEALSLIDWFEERKAYERAWLDEKLARAVEAADRGDEWISAAEFEARMNERFDALGRKAAA